MPISISAILVYVLVTSKYFFISYLLLRTKMYSESVPYHRFAYFINMGELTLILDCQEILVTCASGCRGADHAAITRITYETAVSGSILTLVYGDNGSNLAKLTEVSLSSYLTLHASMLVTIAL